MTACSPSSRYGLATPAYPARPERRPTLTASAHAASGLPSRKGHQRAAAAWPLDKGKDGRRRTCRPRSNLGTILDEAIRALIQIAALYAPAASAAASSPRDRMTVAKRRVQT